MEDSLQIVYIADLAFGYNREVLRGMVQSALLQPRINLKVPVGAGNGAINGLLSTQVNGVILSGLSTHQKIVTQLGKLRLPVVVVSNDSDAQAFPTVCSDDVAVGRMAADYFTARGFKRLAYCGDPDRTWSQQRMAGFTQRASEHGIQVVHLSRVRTPAKSNSLNSAIDCEQWLLSTPKPLAVFAGNDLLASSVVGHCRRNSIRVPEDVSVLGADDDDLFSQLRKPYLSSIRLNATEIGGRALSVLVDLMANGRSASTMCRIPPIRVVNRLSTDIFGIEDGLVCEALRTIQRELEKPCSVKMLCRRLNISRPTLERRFKESLGRSPAAEIERLQMELARDLVIDSNLKMTTIAARTGHSTSKHFSTSFRRYWGQTASSMRSASQFRISAMGTK